MYLTCKWILTRSNNTRSNNTFLNQNPKINVSTMKNSMKDDFQLWKIRTRIFKSAVSTDSYQKFLGQSHLFFTLTLLFQCYLPIVFKTLCISYRKWITWTSGISRINVIAITFACKLILPLLIFFLNALNKFIFLLSFAFQNYSFDDRVHYQTSQ